MDKTTTMLLLALRLAYEEEREKLSLRKEVVVSIRSILDRLMTIGVIDKKLSDRALRDGVNLLAGFRIIERIDGPAHDLDTRLLIYPTILFAIDNQRITRLAKPCKIPLERRMRMKLLRKLLLINWHYIDHELLELENVNFLTGKNASASPPSSMPCSSSFWGHQRLVAQQGRQRALPPNLKILRCEVGR